MSVRNCIINLYNACVEFVWWKVRLWSSTVLAFVIIFIIACVVIMLLFCRSPSYACCSPVFCQHCRNLVDWLIDWSYRTRLTSLCYKHAFIEHDDLFENCADVLWLPASALHAVVLFLICLTSRLLMPIDVVLIGESLQLDNRLLITPFVLKFLENRNLT